MSQLMSPMGKGVKVPKFKPEMGTGSSHQIQSEEEDLEEYVVVHLGKSKKHEVTSEIDRVTSCGLKQQQSRDCSSVPTTPETQNFGPFPPHNGLGISGTGIKLIPHGQKKSPKITSLTLDTSLSRPLSITSCSSIRNTTVTNKESHDCNKTSKESPTCNLPLQKKNSENPNYMSPVFDEAEVDRFSLLSLNDLEEIIPNCSGHLFRQTCETDEDRLCFASELNAVSNKEPKCFADFNRAKPNSNYSMADALKTEKQVCTELVGTDIALLERSQSRISYQSKIRYEENEEIEEERNDDEKSYEGGDDDRDDDSIGIDIPPVSTNVVHSSIHADYVHIGANIYLPAGRSISNDTIRSYSSLDEEDFISDLREALTGQNQMLAFDEASLPSGDKPFHINHCLPLYLDDVGISADSCTGCYQVKSLNDIATLLNGGVRRILVEGPAGYGKSTLCSQITYNWATKKESAFATFDLCFLVQGRQITDSFMQTLLHQVRGDLNGEQDLLHRSLRRSKGKVLIMIDGYNELTDQSRPEVDSLIQLQSLPSAAIIVTSRPHKCADVVKKFQRRLVLLGYSGDQIKEYTNNFSKGAFENLFTALPDKVCFLLNILRSPMYLYFFCSIAHEHQELQIMPSITALFKIALLKAMRRNNITTFSLQENRFLIRFGKLCMQNLKADKVTFLKSELNSCCEDVSVEALLGLGVIEMDYNYNKHRNTECIFSVPIIIMEFFAALYMSTIIESHDFSEFFSTYLVCRQRLRSVLPQFLVGLSAEKATYVFTQLPRSLLDGQMFTICTLAIEMMPFGEPVLLVKYLPESLHLHSNDGYVSVYSKPFSSGYYCNLNNLVVSCGESMTPHDTQTWPRLLDLLSQDCLPIRSLYIELNDLHGAAIDSAFQVSDVIFTHGNIATVSVTALKPTVELCDLLSKLKGLDCIKCLVIDIKILEEFEKLLDVLNAASRNSFRNLQTLVLTHKMPITLPELLLEKLCEVAVSWRQLTKLSIEHIANLKSLNALVSLSTDASQLCDLAVKLDTSVISRSKRVWNQNSSSQLPKAVIKQLTSTCLSPFFLHLTEYNCCLVTLDLSRSCLKSEDVAALTSCVVQPGCRLTSLMLSNCLSVRKEPLSVDLTALTPHTKEWILLDLSGCKVSYKLEKVGIISKLIAFDVILKRLTTVQTKSSNDVSVADIFSVKVLHCNLDNVCNTTNPFLNVCTSVVHLNVCSSSKQAEKAHLSDFFKSFEALPQLATLKLCCRLIATFDAIRESWAQFLSNCPLTNLHLEELGPVNESYDQGKTLFKLGQTALQKSHKLTELTIVAVDVLYSDLWQTYLPVFMKDVCAAFQTQSLTRLNLRQAPKMHKDFLTYLEQWKVQNKYELNVFTQCHHGKTKEWMDITIKPKWILW